MICYVSTNYGERPEDEVKVDVDLYETVRVNVETDTSTIPWIGHTHAQADTSCHYTP